MKSLKASNFRKVLIPALFLVFAGIGASHWVGLASREEELDSLQKAHDALLREIETFPDPSALMVKVAGLASPWVVNISSIVEKRGIRTSMLSESIGSGIIMSTEGHILTNCHVIMSLEEEGSVSKRKIIVTLFDGRKFTAEVIGLDFLSDLGVLRIEADSLIKARLGDSSRVRVGEWVLAVGNAFRFKGSVSHGIVSAYRHTKEFDFKVIEAYSIKGCQLIEENLIQTDAPINPGNSGGPLVNMRGEVIGVNTFIISASGSSHGVGFSIPVNLAKAVFEEIRKKGKVSYGYYGLDVFDLEGLSDMDRRALHIEARRGVLISMVQPGGPAHQAGLRVEDIITGISGDKIRSKHDFIMKEVRSRPGEQVLIEAKRGKEILSLKVKVGERPKPASFLVR